MTQQIKLSFASFAIFLGSIGFATMGAPALASEATGGASLSGEVTTLNGQATFEQHVMLEPMFCELGGPCPSERKAQYYWSMVVDSDGVRYELSSPVLLAKSPEGSEQAPGIHATFNVDGVDVRDGESVSVRGVVQTLSDDYGVISQLESVSVVQ